MAAFNIASSLTFSGTGMGISGGRDAAMCSTFRTFDEHSLSSLLSNLTKYFSLLQI
jgi:hypothetical protein